MVVGFRTCLRIVNERDTALEVSLDPGNAWRVIPQGARLTVVVESTVPGPLDVGVTATAVFLNAPAGSVYVDSANGGKDVGAVGPVADGLWRIVVSTDSPVRVSGFEGLEATHPRLEWATYTSPATRHPPELVVREETAPHPVELRPTSTPESERTVREERR